MSAIRVMLVDDQRLMREGLRTLLDLEEDIEVIGEAGNGEEGVAAFLALRPDVALMDVRMPVLDGVQATIIILTTFDDDEYVLEGLRAGALGYLLKDVGVTELAEAIRAVMRGGVLIEPSVARKVVAELARLRPAPAPEARPAALVEPLSERELEILRLVAAGLTNRDIAQRLFLAEGTVKNYVTNILGKIGARDRTQAAIAARELGLL